MNKKQSIMKWYDTIKAGILWLVISMSMLLVTVFQPAAANAQTAPSAAMYSLTTANQTRLDEVYVALDGNRARLYQRGSGVNAIFCLGTYPVKTGRGSLVIDLSARSRHEARQRLAQSFETIAAQIAGTAPDSALTDMMGVNSPLESIQMFFTNDAADTTAVELALQAFFDDSRLQTIQTAIADIKQGYLAECAAGGNTEAGIKQAKAGLTAQLRQLFEDETVRNVFYEKEILGSLFADMDTLDREIASYYTRGAKIARDGTGAMGDEGKIDVIVPELEALETLSIKAVLMEQYYQGFCAAIGFENETALQDHTAIALWNKTLWECMQDTFSNGERQYDFQSLQQPLDRLVRNCSMTGDAARALRTIQALDRLAGRTDSGRVTLVPSGDAWTVPTAGIVLRPVLDSGLTDWHAWDQWSHEIGHRI
ncbi:MAG: hypothetical protein ABFD81_07235 [Syntrophaceae bacterium]